MSWARRCPRLKDELDGDLLMSGCGELARGLLAEGLVDELRFWVHPVVWGDGARSFEGETVSDATPGLEGVRLGRTLLRYDPLRAG